MKSVIAFLVLAASLLLESCSSGETKKKPDESKLKKVLNAPKKFSQGVHRFDSAVKKVGVGINKFHREIQKYQPDSVKSDTIHPGHQPL